MSEIQVKGILLTKRKVSDPLNKNSSININKEKVNESSQCGESVC